MTYNCIKSQLSSENITAYTYPLYLSVPIQNLFLSKPNIFSKFEGNFAHPERQQLAELDCEGERPKVLAFYW